MSFRREVLLDTATIAVAISALVVATLAVRDRIQGSGLRAGPAADSVLVPNWEKLLQPGHRIGPEGARLVVLEFADFQCPACAGFEQLMLNLRKKYPHDLALVYRHWPLPYHKLAYPAARASECAANQGRFTEYHDELFRLRDSLASVGFLNLARRTGVGNLKEFDRCVRGLSPVGTVEQDILAARELGGRGTPTVVINGVRLGHTPDSLALEGYIKRASVRTH